MTLVHRGFCSLSGGLFVRRRHMSSSYSTDSSDDDRRGSVSSPDHGDGAVSVRRQKRRSSPVSPSHRQSMLKRLRLSTASEQSEGRQYSHEEDTAGLRIGQVQSLEGTVSTETVHIQSEESRSPRIVNIQSEDSQGPRTVHVQSEDSQSPRTVHVQSEEDAQIPKIIQVQSVRDTQNPRTGDVQSEKQAQNPRTSHVQSASPASQSKQSRMPPPTQCKGPQIQRDPKSSQGQPAGGSTGRPHVTKISHKIKINNQLLAFQNPVFFFRWFEHVEKFLVSVLNDLFCMCICVQLNLYL